MRLGVRMSMHKGSGVNAPAEGQIVWCGSSTGNKYVVGKKQVMRLGAGLPPAVSSSNHQREECAEDREVLMEERASNLGLGG